MIYDRKIIMIYGKKTQNMKIQGFKLSVACNFVIKNEALSVYVLSGYLIKFFLKAADGIKAAGRCQFAVVAAAVQDGLIKGQLWICYKPKLLPIYKHRCVMVSIC